MTRVDLVARYQDFRIAVSSRPEDGRKAMLLRGRMRLSELVAVKKLGFDSEFADKLSPFTFCPQHVVSDCAQVARVGSWRDDLMSVVGNPVE